jgi:hypothetical protein
MAEIDLIGLTDEALKNKIRQDNTTLPEHIVDLFLTKLKQSEVESPDLHYTINDIYKELNEITKKAQPAAKLEEILKKVKNIKARIKKNADEKEKKDKLQAEQNRMDRLLEVEDGYMKGICSLSNCVPRIKNLSEATPDYPCDNFKPDDCFTENDAEDLTKAIYDEIVWDKLFENKQLYFNQFNEYLNKYIIDKIPYTYQYLYNVEQKTKDLGISTKLITDLDHPCKDINSVFNLKCKNKYTSVSGANFSIFHIALHSKESKKYTVQPSRRSKRHEVACGYYSRSENTSGVRIGAFHYKIDNYKIPDTLSKSNCESVLGDKSPYKKIIFNSETQKFSLLYDDFDYPAEAIQKELIKTNKLIYFNIFHNCIYNLFICYLNEFMLPTISIKTHREYNIRSEGDYISYCNSKGGYEFLLSKLPSTQLENESVLNRHIQHIQQIEINRASFDAKYPVKERSRARSRASIRSKDRSRASIRSKDRSRASIRSKVKFRSHPIYLGGLKRIRSLSKKQTRRL